MDDSPKVVVDDPDALLSILEELPRLCALDPDPDDPCGGSGVTLVERARTPTLILDAKLRAPAMALGSERLAILTAAMRTVRTSVIDNGFQITFTDMSWALAHDDESSEHLAALDLLIHTCVVNDSFSDFLKPEF